MEGHDTETVWRSNCPAVDDAEKVEEVLEDQVKRGQVVTLSEEDAKRQCPGLVIASLGANRKEKSDGSITARVLHDGSNGIAVNKRTRVRPGKMSPGVRLETCDAREGRKRRNDICLDGGCEGSTSPNPGREGRLAVTRMPCPTRYLRLHKHGRHIRLTSARIRDWQIDAMRCRPVCHYSGYESGRRLSFGDEWRGVSDQTYHFLCHTLAPRSAALVGEDVWW